MRLDDAAANRKSESDTRDRVIRVNAMELLEYQLLRSLRNPRAAVHDSDLNLAGALGGADVDASVRGRVFCGILQEVYQYRFEQNCGRNGGVGISLWVAMPLETHGGPGPVFGAFTRAK
jgi:hypothetical protein